MDEYRKKAKKGIETERLLMREFCQADLEDLYEYAKNPDVGPNAGWKPHETLEDTQKILDGFMSGEGEIIFALVLKENGKVIGSLGLNGNTKRACKECLEIGYALSKDYWGKGLMTEAVKAAMKFGFETLELEMMTVGHSVFNDRSRRVIEKCDFNKEGTIRKAYELFDGTIVDETFYSMTKEEYGALYKLKCST